MNPTLFHRTSCRLCGSSQIELVLALNPIPVSENYSCDPDSAREAKRYPVDLYMCVTCGHVQQLDVIDSKTLWENYTYFSGDAKGMPEHFEEVADALIQRYQPADASLIVDIGSNDGSLLAPFGRQGYRILGIDPAIDIARKASEEGIETIPELMSLGLAKKIRSERGAAAIVCMFNAFAHTDDMSEIAMSLDEILAADGIFVFEAQYLLDIIDRVLLATIFHEHMSHHSVSALVPFFNRHGFEIIHVTRVPIQHGSIIGVVQRIGGKRPVDQSLDEILALENERGLTRVETLRQFANSIADLKLKASRLVQRIRADKAKVGAYGAARSGPTLISQLGLENLIDFIADDHPQKVGKFSSGDGIPIVATSELLVRMPEYTVILAWVHSEKIIAQNQEYLKRGGKFVVLSPHIRLIGMHGDQEI